MKINGKEVHFGQEVEKKLQERGMSKAEFARRIHCSRNNVYNIFKRDTIGISLLMRISKELDCELIKGL